MIRAKASPIVTCPSMIRAFLALTIAAALCGSLHAQTGQTISILMLDGKTGKPIVPDNYIVRFDHLNAIHNEALQLNDDGSGKVAIPANASFFSVQGTYHNSLDIYINCDAGMEKDTSTLHWYPISVILSSGVAGPNECYKSKYAEATRVTAKPGEFIFFVRETSWRESPN
ncbi:MAG TPA: hypothetical protein VGT08_18035 [Terracidiphilus sp.]|nr:hypothetical protein [Terracidiphilus sp.]